MLKNEVNNFLVRSELNGIPNFTKHSSYSKDLRKPGESEVNFTSLALALSMFGISLLLLVRYLCSIGFDCTLNFPDLIHLNIFHEKKTPFSHKTLYFKEKKVFRDKI